MVCINNGSFTGSEEVKRSESDQPVSVTYIGHATVLVESRYFRFITDPIFSKRVAHFFSRRKAPLEVSIEDLPPIDSILISHGHYDHLDAPTLKKFAKDTPIVVSKSLRKIIARLGFSDIRSLSWWEGTKIGKTEIIAVPAFHFSGRPPRLLRNDYQGYIIEGEKIVYFAGDTGLQNDFEEIGEKFEIDLALLPIGAYSPRSFRRHHLSPEDAIKAMELLKAKKMIPIHWGTFGLSFEPITEPPERLAKITKEYHLEDRVFILKPGEMVEV
ncbi:MAG: MBL fold metallo-hydrolase [Methanocellales archaeon]|nr:MBL fold metallo-hydrolase [Methanocellales archaeon]MDD3421108.1 MBL fold metallo-hydrolase [Methanocellales archaeon]MDD4898366.1 MBL fold metallo-hydrolase [Methanocellales archaeon]MDD5446726.1 MBL fold metallo-hydrolase [Methanocellales archaeon]